jgi:hypothetical protein
MAEVVPAALAFSRIAAIVRMSVALQARFIEGRRSRAADEAAEREAEIRDSRVRRALTRYVAGKAVEASKRDAPEVERLAGELEARLEHLDPAAKDFADLPVQELAHAVCRDLGVDPGQAWWDEMGEDLEVAGRPAARKPGSPLSASPSGASSLRKRLLAGASPARFPP